MSILLLFFSFFTIYIIFAGYQNWDALRLAFIKSCITMGVLISLITELLSLNKTLTANQLSFFWLGIILVNVVIIVTLFLIKKIQNPDSFFWKKKKSILSHNKLTFIVIFFILSITLITSIWSAPNNWDSMTYHLPRVMHWIQNQSSHHYPTNNLRQISFSPGASYLTLQLMLLTNKDYFVNCVQWFAFLGSIISISLITQYLLGRNHQWVGGLLTACFPMAIMQSMTTQSDLVTAFWILCFTYLIIKNKRDSIQDVIWASLALSLAILTKPTAFIIGLPLTTFFLVKNICIGNKKEKLLKIMIFTLLSLSLSLPHFLRNKLIFNNYLGIDTDTRATSFGIAHSLSSILKNILINFPLNLFRDLINWLHIHIFFIPIDDPSINLGGRSIMNEGNLLKYLVPHEDFVGSPIYLIIFVLGAIFLFLKSINITEISLIKKNSIFYDKNKKNTLLTLTAIVILSFLLFSILLKWAVFHNRLLLGISLLSIPTSTFFVSYILNKKNKIFILFFLSIFAFFYALTPIRHPLISLPILSSQQQQEQSASILTLKRSDMYFSGSQKDLKQPYREVVDLLIKSRCQYIGLNFQEDTWEYPLWALLKEEKGYPFWIKHIHVSNSSKLLPEEFPSQKICAIVSANQYHSSKSQGLSIEIMNN